MKARGRFMTAQCTAIVLSLVMAFTIFPSAVSAETGDTAEGDATATEVTAPDFVSGQLIVVTEQDTSKKQMRSIARGVNGQVDTMSAFGDDSNVALIEVEEGSELSIADELECDDRVLFVQPNYIYRLEEDEIQEPEIVEEADAALEEKDDSEIDAANSEADTGEQDETEQDFPNDPGYTQKLQSYLAPPFEDGTNAGTINAKGAWDKLAELEKQGKLKGKNKPIIAVLDTGVLFDHEDLQDALLKDECTAFNEGVQMGFTEDDGAYDDKGHGTKVSGIIAADCDNGEGIAGVTGNRAKVFVVDVNTQVTDGETTYNEVYSIDIALGINYALKKKAKLINMSLGAFAQDYICDRAMKTAWDKGTLCVCSAGNASSPLFHYPGDSPYAITVMAHKPNGEPATTFTNYGIEKDISAPGDDVWFTGNSPDSPYGSSFGTSFAAPMVVGSAALLLAARPNLKPREIKNLLYTSTGEQSFSSGQGCPGFGKVNVNTAMENMLAKKTNPKKIVINKPSIEMFKGTKTSIEYAAYPGNTKKTKAKFTSSNKRVVKVNSYGVVTAKSPGKATIKVKCGKKYAKCKVTVKNIPYKTIDKKPYITIDTITMNELMSGAPEVNENGKVLFENANYCHQYRVRLKKNETIQPIMTITEGCAALIIRDNKGKILAYNREIRNKIKYATVTYTAKKAGTYVIQTLWTKASGPTETTYKLVLTSDKSFCEPELEFNENNSIYFSWPAVEGASFYRVREYADKDLKEIVSESTVEETQYSDMGCDSSKAHYFTVTSCVQTKAGVFYNGETPFFVKLENHMSAEGKTVEVKHKTLKKKNITLSRDKVMTVENAEGTLTFAKTSGNKNITVNKKTGTVKVKKGLKKGTYNVEVNVTASGNDEYDAITQTVTSTIIVK